MASIKNPSANMMIPAISYEMLISRAGASPRDDRSYSRTAIGSCSVSKSFGIIHRRRVQNGDGKRHSPAPKELESPEASEFDLQMTCK